VSTNRDSWAYNFQLEELRKNVLQSIEFYNSEVRRWMLGNKRIPVDDFVKYDDAYIGWSRDLKADLKRGRLVEFDEVKLRQSLYRPFTRSNLFLDRVFNEEVYSFPKYLPGPGSESENRIICSPSAGARASFWTLCTRLIPNLALTSIDAGQCFPFYTYAEDGTHRRENITDWALEQFRAHYHDPSITKWDIFHYIYAVLHHPEYRERYAANLRRELPRIPFASLATCHPEQREGSMQPAGGAGAADESIDPPARKERGPQDDKAPE
jgi:predicted helicase